jgi:hypothetical protein
MLVDLGAIPALVLLVVRTVMAMTLHNAEEAADDRKI